LSNNKPITTQNNAEQSKNNQSKRTAEPGNRSQWNSIEMRTIGSRHQQLARLTSPKRPVVPGRPKRFNASFPVRYALRLLLLLLLDSLTMTMTMTTLSSPPHSFTLPHFTHFVFVFDIVVVVVVVVVGVSD